MNFLVTQKHLENQQEENAVAVVNMDIIKRTCPVIHPELANAKANEKPKSTKKCKYCGEYGHNKRTCLKKKN